MSCDLFRTMISADLDDEISTADRAALTRHVDTCAECAAYQARVVELNRTLRVGPASQIPDLTAQIMSHAPEAVPAGSSASAVQRATRRRPHRDARWVLALVGLAQIAIAVPSFFGDDHSLHLGHNGPHTGGWDAAFGLGLLIVAIQPWRARGLLPMAAAVTAIMVGTRVFDAMGGRASSMPEVSHLLEIASLAMLWFLARRYGPPDRDRSTLAPDLAPADSGATGLRVVHPFAALRRPLTASARSRVDSHRRVA